MRTTPSDLCGLLPVIYADCCHATNMSTYLRENDRWIEGDCLAFSVTWADFGLATPPPLILVPPTERTSFFTRLDGNLCNLRFSRSVSTAMKAIGCMLLRAGSLCWWVFSGEDLTGGWWAGSRNNTNNDSCNRFENFLSLNSCDIFTHHTTSHTHTHTHTVYAHA